MRRVPPRVKAIQEELDKCAYEYLRTRDTYMQAKTLFESTREKFAGLRSFADSVMSQGDATEWMVQHPHVRYAGMPIGKAIHDLLLEYAYEQAEKAMEAPDPDKAYKPYMYLDSIVDALEAGGFDFKSATPKREVNAALMQLKNVRASKGGYEAEDAQRFLDSFKK